jgi:hypothetical protein
MMRPFLAALVLSTFALSASADQSDQRSGPMGRRMQQWAADHQVLLDAKLAGLKAGLKLTQDQDTVMTAQSGKVRIG